MIMKPLRLGFLLLVAMQVSAFAQFAPASLNYAMMTQTLTSGTPPFASTGEVNMGLMLGNWFSFSTTGDVAPSGLGTYFYGQTGPNTAVFSPARTNISPIFSPSGTLTFTSATTGTFTLNGTYGGATGSARGTFVLTVLQPLVQPAANTGVAIFEVYEMNGEPGSTRRLTNISTRAFVGTGGQVLIGGFTVGGAATQTVLIRAVGPTLGALGVAGALAAPILTLNDAGGTAIAVNTGWSKAPVLGAFQVRSTIQQTTSASMASVGAFALPTGSADSAMIATLPAGSYTVIVSMQ